MIGISFSDKNQDIDRQIRELLSNNPIPGNISLIYQKNPSFFDAIEVGNKTTELLVVKDNDKVVAFQTRALKEIYINGEIREVGYLSNLRIDKNYQGQGILKMGMNFLKKNNMDSIPFYFSTVISSNKKTLNILTKPRIGGLVFSPQGRYLTKALIILNKKKKINNQYKIIRGSIDNLRNIVEFLNREGKNKNFYPHYKEEDFISGFLRDFKVEDFYIAMKNDDIIGVVGKWNQSGYKQNIIANYNVFFKLYRLVHNSAGIFLKLPPMPKIGEKLNHLYISFIAVIGNNADIFNSLLNAVYNDQIGSENLFLLIGLYDNDKLLQAAKKFFCLTYSSKLYVNYWDGGQMPELDRRLPYIEIATL